MTSGIFKLPADTQLSVIGDFRSSLPFGPSSSAGDLNRDGYTGDLPAGILPSSGCRSLDISLVNAFRAARSTPSNPLTPITQVDCPTYANVDLRLSKFFQIGRARRMEVIAQLFNLFDRANFATPSGALLSGNNATTGRPIFGTPTTLAPNINAPSRQAEFAFRFQF